MTVSYGQGLSEYEVRGQQFSLPDRRSVSLLLFQMAFANLCPVPVYMADVVDKMP